MTEYKIGRNDPCPCGSGKKYKKCCLLKIEELFGFEDLEFEKVLANVKGQILDFSESLGVECDRAEKEFSEKIMLEDDLLAEQLLMEWLSLDFRCQDGQTMLEKFCQQKNLALSPQEQEIIKELKQSFFSLYEAQEVYPGAGVILKDIVTGQEFQVNSKRASKQIVKWDLVFGRVVKVGRIFEFCGCAIFIPRAYKEKLLEFLTKDYKKAKRKVKGLTLAQYLSENAYVIAGYFFELFNQQLPPTLINTDKEKIVFSTALYKVLNLAKILEILNCDDNFDKIELDDSPVHKFTWLKDSIDQSGGRTTLGQITISGQRLKLECNSLERRDKGKKLLGDKLGDIISHLDDYEEEFENKLADYPTETIKPKKEPPLSEEVKNELIKQIREHHAKNWLDAAIPMLDGLTPRVAAISKHGRPKLEELWKYYENVDLHNQPKRGDLSFAMDVGDLKLRVKHAAQELEEIIQGKRVAAQLDGASVKHLPILADLASLLENISAPPNRFSDLLAREMGFIKIRSNGAKKYDQELWQDFNKKSLVERLWQLFATWYYKLDWGMILAKDLTDLVRHLTSFDKRAILIKSLLETKEENYGVFLEKLASDLQMEMIDDFLFHLIFEEAVFKPLASFGLLEIKLSDKNDLKIMTIEAFSLTETGRVLLPHVLSLSSPD